MWGIREQLFWYEYVRLRGVLLKIGEFYAGFLKTTCAAKRGNLISVFMDVKVFAKFL